LPDAYPVWKYYPPRARPPNWVFPVIAAFESVEQRINSRAVSSTSDTALAELRSALVALGFEVEAGKTKAGKLRRPVLFGELGHEELAYEVDAFHPDGIARG